ncbi:hypothetical protein EQP59_05120 [Ornithobacterium rhinotracheale]|uniref:Uncharacterized protein n=1 Tax=Ornithobacterium rhinotracheale TaxID=28251 RepID=A0A3R5UUI1_ORNRH|nr:DUF6402 family protein [Ornithobacterium rhinotracheale]QAR30762.1 hypothetical protein EQP59_05120 [Ornithobacterium rhinotracheale]
MSRTRIVNGKTFIHTEKSHLLYSGKSLIFSAQKTISEEGQKDGVIYGEDFEMEDLEKSSKSDLIKEAYWIDKESSNKTNLMNISSNEINFYIKLDKSTIGKTIKLTIRSLDLVFDDNISVESSFLVKKEEMFFKFNLNAENFQRGGDAIQKLYFLIEIDDEKYKYPLSKDDYLKVHVVHYIPQVMRAQNPSWEVAAKLQDRWFKGNASSEPWKNPVIFKNLLDWILKYSRVKDVYDEIITELWKTDNAIKELKKMIKQMTTDSNVNLKLPSKRGEKSYFGVYSSDIKSYQGVKQPKLNNDKRTENMPLFERFYYQSKSYEISLFEPLDDLTGALASFSFRVIGIGSITNTGNGYLVDITKIGIYIKDSFDFITDGESLGYWSIIDNNVEKLNPFNSDYYKITNNSYQKYRKDYGKGMDFNLYSDIKYLSVNYNFFAKKNEL